jgi:hypothetical protein
MQLERTHEVGDRLDEAENLLANLRSACIEDIFDGVKGCENVALRRVLLTLKRKLYEGQHISAILEDNASAWSLPVGIRNRLTTIGAAETEVKELTDCYETVFTAETTAVGAALRERIVNSDCFDGILLSSGDLWRGAQWIRGASPSPPATARQLRQESALARYMFRSATRTAPFGGFAAVTLLRLPPRKIPTVDDDHRTSHVEPLPRRQRWHSIAQVHDGAFRRWIHRELSDTVLGNLPLRVALQRTVTTDSSTLAMLATPGWGSATHAGAPSSSRSFLRTIPVGPLMQHVLAVADGRSTNEVVDCSSSSAEERSAWRRLVESMIDVGLLERHLPHTGADYAGLLAMSRLMDQWGDPVVARRVREIAELIADYPQSEPPRRAVHISKLKELLGRRSREAPLYVDTALHGIRGEALGISQCELAEVLQPALTLARASITDQPHQLLCNAFVDQFGAGGVCTDVAGFVMGLVQDEHLISRLRLPTAPVAWLNSELGRAISEAETADGISLDVELFDKVPLPPGRFAFATFVQMVASSMQDQLAGDYTVVLNGVQSGRHKYVSRYLGGMNSTAALALTSFRAEFAAADDPLPVELLPDMGINFQIHPLLTPWALETPGGLNTNPDNTIPLSDLTLRFDETVQQLKISSAHAGCDIEPVHLGFLRDLNLPDQVLVLRALSPRIAEETAPERADVYGLIDRSDVLRALPLRRHRPRVQVGKLVLARARWAVPLAEIPMKQSKESHAMYFRRLSRWRVANDLPSRGFVKRLRTGVVDPESYAPPQYLDFNTQFGSSLLQRLLPADGKGCGVDGWLLISELLPAPERALLSIDGRSHVAEMLVEFEGEFAGG